MYPSIAFVAWLVGVSSHEVKVYREIADWPSDWPAKAEARMQKLGIVTVSDALEAFRVQHYYG